ncbi:MAG: hypothetical protein Q9169_006793 [Polycauliona sp. 2 TL-2023]
MAFHLFEPQTEIWRLQMRSVELRITESSNEAHGNPPGTHTYSDNDIYLAAQRGVNWLNANEFKDKGKKPYD